MKNLFRTLCFFIFLVLIGCSSDDSRDPELPMELDFTGKIIGCADFSVSQLLDAGKSNVSLEISGRGRDQMNLSSEFTSFSLPNKDLTARISVWDRPAGGNFCNDVVTQGTKLISSWNAVSGNLKIMASVIEETDYETLYTITIELENVVFENPATGEQRSISNLTMEAGAGWFPG